MKKLLFGLCLLACSCNNYKIKQELKELISKSIEIPTNLTINYNGIDTIIDVKSGVDLKYIIYMDSLSCNSCYINKMYLWHPFLEYAAKFEGKLRFYFIFHPKMDDKVALYSALRNISMDYPMLIDVKGEFKKLNPHLPNNKQLHSFILDNDNNVIFVGNPLNSNEIEKLFFQKMQEFL